MIQVIESPNTSFFLFLYNIISGKKENRLHPLGMKVMSKYKHLPDEVVQLETLYQQKLIPTHPFYYCVFAINTEKSLLSKTISPKDGYGERLSTIYTEKIYPLAIKIEKELDFLKFLKKEISPESAKINEKIEKIFDNRISSKFTEVWEIDVKEKLLLVPNVLSLSHSFGLFRKKRNYSISSPVLNKQQEVEFNSQNLISNAIHEFSHSILKKKLIKGGNYKVVRELTEGLEIPVSLSKIHQKPEEYMEETFIKSITLFIQSEIFKDFMSSEDIEIKNKKILESLVNSGYVYAPEFFSKLVDNDPSKVYLDIIKRFYDNEWSKSMS